ncbi:MAG TPA: ABC transporter substrate-binding protein, partial [Longimicrobium sp.]|nr:ABC transporter substrate-binding protein [Longimicrobium sp.]
MRHTLRMLLARSPGAATLRAPALAFCAAASLALAACGGEGGEPLLLGLAVPLTDTEGAEDTYGVRSRLGAELAVEEINKAGGIGRRPLALRVVNDKGDPESAIPAADSLVNDPRVLAVVGHVYSGATIKAAAAYEGRLAALATSATSPEVSRLGPWIYRVASSDSANAVALAQMARQMGRRIGVLYANDDYGQGLARNFMSALQKNGVAAVAADPFLDETEDF